VTAAFEHLEVRCAAFVATGDRLRLPHTSTPWPNMFCLYPLIFTLLHKALRPVLAVHSTNPTAELESRPANAVLVKTLPVWIMIAGS